MMAWGWGQGDSLRGTGSTGLGEEEVSETREKSSRAMSRKLVKMGWMGLLLSVVGSTGKKRVMESSVHKTVVRPTEHPGEAVSWAAGRRV